MLITLRRVLSFPSSSALSGASEAGSGIVGTARLQPKQKGKLPIAQIKQCMELVLHDVGGDNAGRALFKIRAARNVDELWMLRSDMYQAISMLHTQSEATRRINSLLPCFSQWIATRQLSAI